LLQVCNGTGVKKIIDNSGLLMSFGLSVNKIGFKVATGEKPNNLMIDTGFERDFLAPLSIAKYPR
jgi:DNA polymerase-4